MNYNGLRQRATHEARQSQIDMRMNKPKKCRKNKFNPNSEDCADAMKEFLERGGQITTLDTAGLGDGKAPRTPLVPDMVKRNRRCTVKAKDKTGREWSVSKFAELAGGSYNWAFQIFKKVRKGELDFDELLEQARAGKIPSREAKSKSWVLVGKIIDESTGKPKKYTVASIMADAGVGDQTAIKRMKLFRIGKIAECDMLDNRRGGARERK